MKKKLYPVISVALLAASFGLVTPALAAPAARCNEVANDVKSRVQKDPSQVLLVVEDNMVKNEKCACEIVKAAIQSSKADKQLVKQIVFTAVAASPGMSSTISECAMSVKPDAVAQIKEALQSALGAGASSAVGDSGSGKSGFDFSKDAKQVIPAATAVPASNDGIDWGQSPVDITGVYLVAPISAGPIAPSPAVSPSVAITVR